MSNRYIRFTPSSSVPFRFFSADNIRMGSRALKLSVLTGVLLLTHSSFANATGLTLCDKLLLKLPGVYYTYDRARWAVGHAKVQINLRRSNPDAIIAGQIEDLRALPKRDLSKDAISAAYLEKHKVYVSMTTSPERIGKVLNVIKTLDLENVEEVIVSLPLKYGRNGTEYTIPDELVSFPKVKILRPEVDYGPATKLLPAAEYAASLDPASRVITVDDDIGYPNGMVNDLIYFSARLPNAAVGGASAKLSFWGIDANFPKTQVDLNLPPSELIDAADVLEGFGAVSYPAGAVDSAQIKKWAQTSKECLASDDLTISMSLQKNGVARYGVRSSYYNRGSLTQFTYGFGTDALHKGAGLNVPAAKTPDKTVNVNQHKYQITFDKIKSELFP